MLNFTKYVLTLLVVISSSFALQAQITIDTTATAEHLVKEVFKGKGVMVKNVNYKGHDHAIGEFTNPMGVPHYSHGFIMSTGNVFTAGIKNAKANYGTKNNKLGAIILKQIEQGATLDGASLEFEFQTAADSVSFHFFFASEEYNEYIGTEFNDIFAIWVIGPGYMSGKNLAVVPGTKEPITVNTINGRVNSDYYIDNNPFSRAGTIRQDKLPNLDEYTLNNFSFDGMTTSMEVGCRVKPKTSYKLRIVIADKDDELMDSALLFEAESFQTHEQAWRVRRREEKRIADSLLVAQARMDSIAAEQARLDSIAALAMDTIAPTTPEDSLAAISNMDSLEATGTADPDPVVVQEAPVAKDTSNEAGEIHLSPVTPLPDVAEYKAVIPFDDDRITLNEDQRQWVDHVVTQLNRFSEAKVGIYSETPDNVDAKTAKRLANLRSLNVEYLLIGEGIDPERIYKSETSFTPAMEDDLTEKAPGTGVVELWVK